MNTNRWKVVSGLLSALFVIGMTGCGGGSESDSSSTGTSLPNNDLPADFKVPPVMIAGDGLSRARPLSELTAESSALDSIKEVSLPSNLVKTPEPIQLRFNPNLDSRHDYEMMVIRKLEVEGNTYHRHDQVQTTLRRIESENESAMALEIETRRVKIGFEKDPEELSYDTTNPIIYSTEFATSIAGILQAAIDEPMRVTTDQTGGSFEIDYPTALVDALDASPDASLVGTDDAYLCDAVRQCIIPFPSEPVSDGDSWESTGNWSRFGPEITLISTYRLEGLAVREGVECAVISYETKTEGDASSELRFENLGFTLQGVVFVEVDTGQLVELINQGDGATDLQLERGMARDCDLQFRTKLVRVDS